MASHERADSEGSHESLHRAADATSSPSPLPAKDIKMSVASLLSPPEASWRDSFSSTNSQIRHDTHPTQVWFSSHQTDPAASKSLPLSPPFSDNGKANDQMSFVSDNSSEIRDPQLFSRRPSDVDVTHDGPLFPAEHPADADVGQVISQHIASKQAPLSKTSPTAEEYGLFAEFVSIAWKNSRNNPAWPRREWEILSHYGPRNRIDKSARYKAIAPAPLGSRKVQRATGSSPTQQRTPRQRVHKRTPKSASYDAFDSPKTPRAPANRDDTDYNSLRDVSPSIDALHLSKNAFKIDWKGQVLDLSSDPDVGMLHENEVQLAATLRLSAATYLCSKRRIFLKRLETLDTKKEFRKTDAQQACKIDVNKASKLWTVFDRNGMFNRSFFEGIPIEA